MFRSSDCSWALLVFLLVATNVIVASKASIHAYSNDGFSARLNVHFYQGGTEALYGSSSISFNEVTFVRTVEAASKQNATESTTGLVEAIVFDVKDLNKIGGFFLKTTDICCTRELAEAGSCSLGEVIITRSPKDLEGPIRIKTFFQGNKTEATMFPEAVRINKTGMYYLYFMICDPQLDDTVIKGRTVWKNPHGYLPGKVASLLEFFGFISVAYLALGLVWFIRVVQYRKTLVQLQFYVTSVVTVAMCEMCVRYFECLDFNSTGLKRMWLVICFLTFSTIKKTVSRVLLLLVSMGYSVKKVTVRSSIVVLGIIYLAVTGTLELFESWESVSDLPRSNTVLVLVIQVAFLDVFFIVRIFSALAKSLEEFQMSRNMSTLDLYRKLTSAFAIFVVISLVWFGFELYLDTTDPMSKLWEMAWIVPAFWHCLSFGFLGFICILWAPSNNFTRKKKSGEEEGFKESEEEAT